MMSPVFRKTNSGFMLLEVLVSILLFALGIVALVGLQGRALSVTGDVQTRAEAAHLANTYIAKMWTYSGATFPNLFANFVVGGGEYNAFAPQVARLPGTAAVPAPNPQVVIVPQSFTTGSGGQVNSALVTITISWSDNENAVHSYTQVATVGY